MIQNCIVTLPHRPIFGKKIAFGIIIGPLHAKKIWIASRLYTHLHLACTAMHEKGNTPAASIEFSLFVRDEIEQPNRFPEMNACTSRVPFVAEQYSPIQQVSRLVGSLAVSNSLAQPCIQELGHMSR